MVPSFLAGIDMGANSRFYGLPALMAVVTDIQKN
jgi:hypothetical protein